MIRGTQLRLFLTCWIVFVLHFATDFAREHYLVLSIAEKSSFRLDDYVGLHDDIFQTPDHGAHHSANPGSSMIAVIPYFVFQPVVNYVDHWYSGRHPGKTINAVYRDPRPAHAKFYQKVRERGWDIKFGLAGFITMAFCMAPLSAFSAVLMFRTLGHLGLSVRASLWYALLYALGTPVFFRTGYLNHNLMVGIFGFAAFVLLWQPGKKSTWTVRQRHTMAGFLAGLALLCDYSGLILLSLLGTYAWIKGTESASLKQSGKDTLWYLLGAAGPVGALWFYQWTCFGNPFYPPQHFMPPQNQYVFSGYKGFGLLDPGIFWMLLFDVRFGLFVVSPILLPAFVAPLYHRFRGKLIPSRETVFLLVCFLAFVFFFSGVQYTRLQWITGFRYLVPVIPFLFLLTVEVMLLLPEWFRYGLGAVAIISSWCLAMVRSQQGPGDSLALVMVHGFQLPWLNTLFKMAPQYAPFLSNGLSALPLFLFTAVILYALWRSAAVLHIDKMSSRRSTNP